MGTTLTNTWNTTGQIFYKAKNSITLQLKPYVTYIVTNN